MGAPQGKFTRRPCCSFLIPVLVAAGYFPGVAFSWPSVELEATLDNTLYETEMDMPPEQNELSNGMGIFLFAGRTGLDGGFRLRRALLKFDLEALPAGSEILAAELVLYHSQAAPGSPPSEMTLHRVLQEWGEGASDAPGPEGQGAFAEPGDATWFHRLYDSEIWRSPGGDFVDAASTSATVGSAVGDFVWPCTQALIEDLNEWLGEPDRNFGWLLKGFEASGGNAHRFHSRQHFEGETRPRLRVVFRPPGVVFSDGFEAQMPCH